MGTLVRTVGSPEAAAGLARAPGDPREQVLVLHVRWDGERLGVPARHQQPVQKAAVAQPQICERAPVAIALVDA